MSVVFCEVQLKVHLCKCICIKNAVVQACTGWLGHRWVGYSFRLWGPKSIRLCIGLLLLALCHLCHCLSVCHFTL